jgi:hypothetical protein
VMLVLLENRFHCVHIRDQVWLYPQSTQSDGPFRFLIFCSISIFLPASLVAGKGPQCSAGPPEQGMYSTIPVECVYCTEPKAMCRQCKNQPNVYNMYTDLEGFLSACLYLHISFYSGVVHFCRYAFPIGG